MKKLLCLAAFAASPVFADQEVTLNFVAEIGGKPFSCSETYSGLGSTDAEIQATDFRAYISDVVMVKADGSTVPVVLAQDIWQNDATALLDFEDASGGCTNGTAQTNTSIRGTVPEGEYTSVAFTVGVPFTENHGDPTTAPSPLDVTSMFWNWQFGYKFFRIDMVPTDRAEDGPKGWFLHLGSTMCEAASKTEAPSAACGNPNHMRVTLNGTPSQTIVIDPAPVVADVDLRANTPDTSPGCMSMPSDPDCDTVIPKLGLTFKDLPAAEQALFTVR